MAKTFYVGTHAMTYYDNLIQIDEEDMAEYQAERPDLTEEEIVTEMFMDGTYKMLDAIPTDYYDEVVDEVKRYDDAEDEDNV